MLQRPVHLAAVVTKPRAGVRPTTRKVFEAMFAILDGVFDGFEGLRVLDAFAGIGQLGLEALQRGASHVTFIERDATVAGDLRRRLGRDERLTVVRGDACDVLARLAGPFDLVFIDPPYSVGLAARAVELIGRRGLVAPGGWVVAEHHHKDVLPEASADVAVARRQRYGETTLTFYQRPMVAVPTSCGPAGPSGVAASTDARRSDA